MAKKKPAEEKPDNIRRERFQQSLKVTLTKEEVAERANRAGHKHASIYTKEAELKAVTKHHKGIIETEEAELTLLLREVCDESTYRQIECERQFDFMAKMYREIRTDTGEIINERRLLPSEAQSEAQMELPFPDPDEQAAATGNPNQAPRDILKDHELPDGTKVTYSGPLVEPDESWRLVPIADALGKSIGTKAYAAFEKANIATMGDLADFQNKHGEFWVKDLQGVGSETAGKIADAAEAFWASQK